MKIKGAEFMEWYDNHFPEGYYFDTGDYDRLHNEDGSWKLLPDETYDTDELGYLGVDSFDTSLPDIETDTAIRRWRKSRDFDVVSVQVPKGKLDEVKAALKALGCTVK